MSLVYAGLKKKFKSADELVKAIKESINAYNVDKDKKKSEEASKNITLMKLAFAGEDAAILAKECLANDFIAFIIQNIGKLEFESKKDFVTVFCTLLRREIGGRFPSVDHFSRNQTVTDLLIKGTTDPENFQYCGQMLRECLRYPPLGMCILGSDSFWEFFNLVKSTNFDLSSDAFSTLKVALKIPDLSLAFLKKNHQKFFECYRDLLQSSSYVIKRQSLQLLGDILLDRSNFEVMTIYVSSSTNLKLVMNMLIDKNKSIRYEAFHIFKLFLANPNKPPLVIEIFTRNREKLLYYIDNFHPREETEVLEEEKAFLVRQIEAL